MTLLGIALIIFVVLETLNVVLLYKLPGSSMRVPDVPMWESTIAKEYIHQLEKIGIKKTTIQPVRSASSGHQGKKKASRPTPKYQHLCSTLGRTHE